jgi:hypothetical protein
MAQVYGDYDSPPPSKLKYDLLYIRSMSLWLDVKLITLAVVNTLTARWGHAKSSSREGEAQDGGDVVPFNGVSDEEESDARSEAA